MALNVNTIEFAGRKAVINSYSEHPLLDASCAEQLASWQARFPNATVKTERLSEAETVRLVAEGDHLYCHAHDVGRASEAYRAMEWLSRDD